MRKPTFWFPTWSDTNQAVQLQKMSRGLKEEELYYLCSEKKGTDQLRGYPKLIWVFVFAYAKCWISHDMAHFLLYYNFLHTVNYNLVSIFF